MRFQFLPLLLAVLASAALQAAERAVLQFNRVSDLPDIFQPFGVHAIITAVDAEGNPLPIEETPQNFSFTTVNGDGTTLPANFQSAPYLENGRVNARVLLPTNAVAPFTIRVMDANGISGQCMPLGVSRRVTGAGAVSAVIRDPKRELIYASVSNVRTNRGPGIIAINPKTYQTVASLTLSPQITQLELTSGNEFLYVRHETNARISRVDLNSFTTNQTFKLGTNRYGQLLIEDFATVAGEPDLLVISQYNPNISPRHKGVVITTNGVSLANSTFPHLGSNLVEPSADPTIFFGYNIEGGGEGLRILKRDSNGVIEITNSYPYLGGVDTRWMRAQDNLVLGDSGVVMDGALRLPVGKFNGARHGAALELSRNRVYSTGNNGISRLAADDSKTFNRVVHHDGGPGAGGDLIRWGTNGLAFPLGQETWILTSAMLIPTAPEAELSTTISVSPSSASSQETLRYTAVVKNTGPNPAPNTGLKIYFQYGQNVQRAIAATGYVTLETNYVALNIGTLGVGETRSISIDTLPETGASLLWARATAFSSALDPHTTNNTAEAAATINFKPGPDTINLVRVPATHAVVDPGQNLIWLAARFEVEFVRENRIVSIDPRTGVVSPAIFSSGNGFSSLAISPNGQYLYVGLTDLPFIQRINLRTRTPDLRIPLGFADFGKGTPRYARDMEILPGDGSAVLVARSDLWTFGAYPRGLGAYDGATPRFEVEKFSPDGPVEIEATSAPDIFIGSDTGSGKLMKYSVTSAGAQKVAESDYYILRPGAGITGDGGDLVLSTFGELLSVSTLTRLTNFTLQGLPALDTQNHLALIYTTPNTITVFDTTSYNQVATLTVPPNNPNKLLRWGADGLALVSEYADLALIRTSALFPNVVDLTLANFNAGFLKLESWQTINDAVPFKLHISENLQSWRELAAAEFSEQVVDTQTTNGVQRQKIQYTINLTPAAAQFFRLIRP